MILGDILDRVSGVSSGLEKILDSTKTTNGKPAAQPATKGPVQTGGPNIPTWLAGAGLVLSLVVIAFVFFKVAQKAA